MLRILLCLLSFSFSAWSSDVRTELEPWFQNGEERGETTLGNTCSILLIDSVLILSRGPEVLKFNADPHFHLVDVQHESNALTLRLYADRRAGTPAVTQKLKIIQSSKEKRVKLIQIIHNMMNTTDTITCLISNEN